MITKGVLQIAFISKTTRQIKPSATIALSMRTAEFKKNGKNIISLGAGEPDFDTPDHIKQAAIKAIEEGQTKYTVVDGTYELKQAICAKFKRDNNLDFLPENITVSNGGKHIIFNALMATLDQGDEVIIPAPYWVSYPDMVTLCGGRAIIAETSEDINFKLTPEKLESLITPQTKWLFLNSPSNPSGCAYSYDEIKSLAEVLLKYPNIWILSDDIYEHIIFDDFKFTTIADAEPELKGRTLTMNGVSKAYAMTGWRIGYAGAPKILIDAMRKIQSQSTSNPCSISQAAATSALNGDQSFLKARAESFKKRRDYVVQKLNEIEGISCSNPEGAFYVFPNCFGILGKKTQSGQSIKNDLELCEYLLEDAGISLVYGQAFGLKGYFRISYASSMKDLIMACEQIKKSINKLEF